MPCKMISPVFEEYSGSKEFSDVTFVKVDVDDAPDVASRCVSMSNRRVFPPQCFLFDNIDMAFNPCRHFCLSKEGKLLIDFLVQARENF